MAVRICQAKRTPSRNVTEFPPPPVKSSFVSFQSVYMAHALKRISYATCDPEFCQFSFLAREPKGHTSIQYCHAFITKSSDEVWCEFFLISTQTRTSSQAAGDESRITSCTQTRPLQSRTFSPTVFISLGIHKIMNSKDSETALANRGNSR